MQVGVALYRTLVKGGWAGTLPPTLLNATLITSLRLLYGTWDYAHVLPYALQFLQYTSFVFSGCNSSSKPCNLCFIGWPVISMRFVHYSLFLSVLEANSFANKYSFGTSSYGLLSFSSSTLTWHLLWCLLFIAQYHNFWLQHPEAVYILLPQVVYKGPALIFYIALKRTSILLIRDTLQQQFYEALML